MAHTTILPVRVDNDIKTQAGEALAAMEEARAMMKTRAVRFGASNDLLGDLEKARE